MVDNNTLDVVSPEVQEEKTVFVKMVFSVLMNRYDSCVLCKKNKKNMKKIVLMMTMVAMLFVACDEKNVSLEGTSWNLVELNGKAVDRAILTDTAAYTLNFEKNEEGVRAYGMGDCNRFFGMAKIDMEKGSVELVNLASTRAMCPNQQLEDEYIQALTKSTSYKVKKGELSLLNGETIIAKFKKD